MIPIKKYYLLQEKVKTNNRGRIALGYIAYNANYISLSDKLLANKNSE